MANFFEVKDRRVIPNFRSLLLTEKLGDLKSSSADQSKIPIKDLHFDLLKSEWELNKSIGYAADLISTGIIVDSEDNIVQSAARYLIKSEGASKSQKSLASLILNKFSIKEEELRLDWFIDNNNYPSAHDKNPFYERISFIKKQINAFPYNALNYVELARLYLILGQKEKANGSMLKAIYIGSHNRYVLRSAVRLFLHFGELDIPHFYLRKYPDLKKDPWLLSAEIALSTVKERDSKFIKTGINLLNSNNYSPFSTSELSAALGTVELLSGSLRKSKKLFAMALKCPNDNSLAQAEWASNKDSLFNLNPSDFENVCNKYEALSLDNYYNENWKQTVENAEKWFIDSPFSKTPILLGSHVACAYLNHQEQSVTFCKAGLLSHPNDPQLLNNIAYSLALLNEIKEAESYLEKVNIETVEDSDLKVCLMATKGLIEFRKKNVKEGRQLYLKAIERTKGDKQPKLHQLAILNYAREEIIADIEQKEGAINLINQIDDKSSDLEIKVLKQRVQRVIDEYKKK